MKPKDEQFIASVFSNQTLDSPNLRTIYTLAAEISAIDSMYIENARIALGRETPKLQAAQEKELAAAEAYDKARGKQKAVKRDCWESAKGRLKAVQEKVKALQHRYSNLLKKWVSASKNSGEQALSCFLSLAPTYLRSQYPNQKKAHSAMITPSLAY